MNFTNSPQSKQGGGWVPSPDYPATPDEALGYALTTTMPMLAGGQPIPGCERLFPPSPLPDRFFGRLVASVAADPVSYGRLIRHALRSTSGGTR